MFAYDSMLKRCTYKSNDVINSALNCFSLQSSSYDINNFNITCWLCITCAVKFYKQCVVTHPGMPMVFLISFVSWGVSCKISE